MAKTPLEYWEQTGKEKKKQTKNQSSASDKISEHERTYTFQHPHIFNSKIYISACIIKLHFSYIFHSGNQSINR